MKVFVLSFFKTGFIVLIFSGIVIFCEVQNFIKITPGRGNFNLVNVIFLLCRVPIFRDYLLSNITSLFYYLMSFEMF